ncbi:DUF4268 domain-containing protein [bacterium]|nr:DUF4268 domain-containing protein [bacterium]
MTEEKITLEEAFKSKAKFEELMVNSPMPIEICEVMQDYPKKPTIRIAELTQNFETFLNKVGEEGFDPKQYLVWITTNPKDKIINTIKAINNPTTGLGTFIFKASLNEDKTEFECILKPNEPSPSRRVKNENTPAKQNQKVYWETYITVCDASEHPNMQIKEALPRHYQNISIGKSGVQILQTINTRENYVASEIAINNDKSIFERLIEHKSEIEKEVGKLEWYSKEGNTSSKIRKVFNIDVNLPKNHEQAATEQVEIANELTQIVYKYL